MVAGGRISIQHGGQEVAVHPEYAGRRQPLIEPAHFSGVSPVEPVRAAARGPRPAALLRQLTKYEQVVGGGW